MRVEKVNCVYLDKSDLLPEFKNTEPAFVESKMFYNSIEFKLYEIVIYREYDISNKVQYKVLKSRY